MNFRGRKENNHVLPDTFFKTNYFEIRRLESLNQIPFCAKSKFREFHRIHFDTIIISLQGIKNYEVNFEKVECGTPCVYWTRKYQIHKAEFPFPKGYVIWLNDQFIENPSLLQLYQKMFCIKGLISFSKRSHDFKRILFLCEQLLSHQSEDMQDPLNAEFGTHLLICVLNRIYQSSGPEKFLARQDEYHTFHAFMELVYTHASKTRRLNFFLKKLNISRNKLIGICKKISLQTPGELIAGHLFRESVLLLKQKAFSVKEIAYRLGFSETSNFIRFFKQHAGTSPMQYQKKTN
ncbi:MAG: helix-turn-helix domain-containing protein [Chitinophagaceae bacterium]|nr:helix-turn-helix domain-containing protein [Chitinophagaceae bacterium]